MTVNAKQIAAEIEELFSFYSDMHKDVYGSRPRGLYADQRYSADWLKGGIAELAAKFPTVADAHSSTDELPTVTVPVVSLSELGVLLTDGLRGIDVRSPAQVQKDERAAKAKASANRERHGGPYDRGSADAWYARSKEPHYFVGGTYQSKRVTDLTPAEIADYHAGYDAGPYGQKDWG